MKRQERFKSNGGEEPSLATPSLVERVVIAILHDKPEKDPEEVLREVKRSVLNLRLEYWEHVERALKENLAMQEESRR
jgi:ActR/RegA family two-component response regulator